MRTASRRARRLGALLLLAAGVWWAFVRRRAGTVVWAEPRPSLPPELGPPGTLADDILATDAGLTPLPTPPATDAAPPAADAASAADAAPVEDLAPAADAAPPAEAAPVGDVAPAADAPAAAEAAPLEDVAPAADVVPAADVAPAAEAAPVEDLATAADVSAAAEAAPAAEASGDDAAAGVDEATDVELVRPGDGVDEPTMTIAREGVGEETGTRIPMPTFSEAPTMEIPAVTDDLRALRGIGPSMERMLHTLGIVSYRQLAMLDGAELERVRGELSDFRSRIEREDWVGQARALYRDKYGRDPD